MDPSDSETPALPDEHRRRFLRALAVAGAAGLAGCGGGGGSGGTEGGGVDGGGGGSGGDGGSGSFPSPPGGAVDDSGGQFVAEETAPFLLNAGTVDTTFDVDLTEETDLLAGEALGALTDFDLDAQQYTFDADLLAQTGIDPEPGRVLMISGLSLRRVTDVSRDGGRVVVDTEFAALNEAIQDGEVAWDADLGFDAGQTNERFEPSEENDEGALSSAVSNAALVDVVALDADGNALGRPELSLQGDQEVLELKFTQGNTDYVFGLTPMGDSVRLKAEMTAPSGAPATMRFTGVGEAKAVKAGGQVNYAGGDLQQADIDANGLEGEIVIDIAATGTGVEGPTEIPLPGGFAFKHIFMAGPVPITVETSIRLKANINVVSEASATARSRFTFGGDTGFAYDGTDVTPKAKIGTLNINPESADSGALFGQPVSAGFGVAFPRVSISIFEQLLIPYIEVGMAVNTELTWGPVCKSAYIQLVVNGGYDMKILGVELAKFKTTLAEKERRGGEECASS
jgi:hypothetical protein